MQYAYQMVLASSLLSLGPTPLFPLAGGNAGVATVHPSLLARPACASSGSPRGFPIARPSYYLILGKAATRVRTHYARAREVGRRLARVRVRAKESPHPPALEFQAYAEAEYVVFAFGLGEVVGEAFFVR